MTLSTRHSILYTTAFGKVINAEVEDGRLTLSVNSAEPIILPRDEAERFLQMLNHAMAQWWERTMPGTALTQRVQHGEGKTDGTP